MWLLGSAASAVAQRVPVRMAEAARDLVLLGLDRLEVGQAEGVDLLGGRVEGGLHADGEPIGGIAARAWPRGPAAGVRAARTRRRGSRAAGAGRRRRAPRPRRRTRAVLVGDLDHRGRRRLGGGQSPAGARSARSRGAPARRPRCGHRPRPPRSVETYCSIMAG